MNTLRSGECCVALLVSYGGQRLDTESEVSWNELLNVSKWYLESIHWNWEKRQSMEREVAETEA